MKNIKIILAALLVSLAASKLSFAVVEGFSDVPETHTNATAIQYVKNNNIVEGYSDGSFRPDNPINRVEFLKIIIETTMHQDAIALCNTENYRFSDTATDTWYSPYICMGKSTGIIGGYADGSFKPASEINFVEAAKIINIAYDQPASSSDVWYEDYVEYLGDLDAIPTSISSFDKKITRGEMAEMIYRIDAEVMNKPSQTLESLSGDTIMDCHEDHCHETSQVCIDEGCNEITITTDTNYRYIMSNGIPNHETGDFPNSGNPNTITEQDYDYRVTLNPVYKESTTTAQVPGVALNGVFFEPGTAERNGNWSYEAFQNELNLGLDEANAHVQPTGAYHYHGIPTALVESLEDGGDLVQVGWAADGFPMYVSLSDAYLSSWQLKTGTRSDIGGAYDGTYTQDFEYLEESGTLDECNGALINGSYAYVLTSDFPYISRCLHGTPDDSFSKGGGGAGPTGGQQATGGPTGGPPQGAIDSCSGKSDGSSCSFTDGPMTINGSCGNSPDGLVCKP